VEESSDAHVRDAIPTRPAPQPLREADEIAGRIAFFNELVYL
jgi:hypothetical protein